MRTFTLEWHTGAVSYRLLSGPLIMGKLDLIDGKWKATCYLKAGNFIRSFNWKQEAIDHMADTFRAKINVVEMDNSQ